MTELEKAILKTLAYADVFDYPLTVEEIGRWMIDSEKCKVQPACRQGRSAKCKVTAQNLKFTENIEKLKNYYFLKGRKEIVAEREKREKYSVEKLKIARRTAKWLRKIPWVKMVGITGALAMKNTDENDDIDLLIIACASRLWLTRLAATLLTNLLAKRRRPNEGNIKNKICLNMFLEENHLSLPENEWDLYSAHEVCQLVPLINKDKTYERFLGENGWVRRYLPRAGKFPSQSHLGGVQAAPGHPAKQTWLPRCIENLAYKLQRFYMAKRITSEIVEPHRIRFHPQDCRKKIIGKYRERIRRLLPS